MNEIEYFKGDDLAASVWRSKYALDTEDNPNDMHRRLAKEFARIESSYWANEKPTAKGLSEYGKKRGLEFHRTQGEVEIIEESIYNLFKDFKYIVPQGSIMYGLGRKDKYVSLSNCFVLSSPLDSYGGIMKTDQEQVQLMKRRAGVGHDLSNLRPAETKVTNSAGTSTGVTSFMERFSNSTREVGQNSRRGALMLSIDINHPDVEQFATIKSDLTKVTGANISIKLNKRFMEAVEKDEDYILKWPCNVDINNTYWAVDKNEPDYKNRFDVFDYEELYSIYHGSSGDRIYIKKIKAKELWNTIITQARNNAEPGLMFWDNVLDNSPDGVYDEYKPISSNPCGEQFLQAEDSCRLMCLNLYSFVVDPFTDHAIIDYQKLYEITYEQQRLMDDLVDLEIESIEKIIQKILDDPEPMAVKGTELSLWKRIKKTAESGRRTGSGITGLADMLAALGVKYDSEEGLEIAEKVMKTKMKGELDCTIDLAILRGPFEGWDNTKESMIGNFNCGANSFYTNIINEFPEQWERMCEYGRRQISWSTIAPTGSVSILCQTSSGCEPVFMPFYMRRKKINPNDKGNRIDFTDDSGDKWQEYPVLHPKFKDWFKVWNGDQDYIWELFDKEALQEAFEQSPWYKSTANDIKWQKRVKMQSILQKYTTNAISSTLNVRENITTEEVKSIYEAGYKYGLKGVTIYREGSRSGVLVNKKEFNQYDAPKRPKRLSCDIHHLTAKGQRWTVLVGLFEDKPYEVFALSGDVAKRHDKGTLTKKGKGEYSLGVSQDEEVSIYSNITEEMSDEEAGITRLISTSLRHGADIQFVSEQLDKADGSIVSFTKAISRTLKKYISEDKLIERSRCEECGSTELVFEEGCLRCCECGSSRCG